MNTGGAAFPCQGSCEEHSGEVKLVNIRDPRNGCDWGGFMYCENAIAEDRRRGFEVEVLPVEVTRRDRILADAMLKTRMEAANE